MKKSIFTKYFATTAVIILVSFTVFGTALMMFSRNLWLNEKDDLLVENVKTISDISSEVVGTYDFRVTMARTIGAISDVIGADVFIVDNTGQIVIYSKSDKWEYQHKSNVVSESITKTVLSMKGNEYKEMGTLGGMYEKKCYSVAVPLYNQSMAVGAVFAAVPISDLNVYLWQILTMVLFSATLAIMLSFIAVYFVTASFTKPLRAMAEASKNMAKGDFVTRIPIGRDDEVGELAAAFNHMAQSLASLEQMRRSFISNVSHELKTPMTTIAGFIDGILDGTIKQEQQKQYLSIVSEEVKRLSRLVNSMLQLAKLEQGQIQLSLTQFNITDTVVRALLSFEQKIEEKDIEIKGIEDAPTIKLYADIDLIHQVVYNLLDNAIKFTPEKGYIKITICETEDDVAVLIRNSGEGISARELTNVFERFYKSDRSRGMDKSSMGLGLYLVKSIIDIHTGKVIARSVEGQYTEFEFNIPKGLGNNERI